MNGDEPLRPMLRDGGHIGFEAIQGVPPNPQPSSSGPLNKYGGYIHYQWSVDSYITGLGDSRASSGTTNRALWTNTDWVLELKLPKQSDYIGKKAKISFYVGMWNGGAKLTVYGDSSLENKLYDPPEYGGVSGTVNLRWELLIELLETETSVYIKWERGAGASNRNITLQAYTLHMVNTI